MMRATVRFVGHLLICSATFVSANVWALDASDWFGRIGASMVDPATSSGGVPGIAGSGVDVEDDTQLSVT